MSSTRTAGAARADATTSQRLAAALRWPWAGTRPAHETWLTTSRRVYIVPTRSGLVFAALMLALLVASINDRLNLGFALCFTLVGSGLAAMWQTQRNLRGLTLRLLPLEDGVAGQPMSVTVQVSDTEQRPRMALCARWTRDAGNGANHLDVPSGGSGQWQLSLTPRQRGHERLPAIRVESHYPLGLFVCWTVWQPAMEAWVWPAPESPAPAWPQTQGQDDEEGDAVPSMLEPEPDCLEELRPYRPGDRLRQVAWRQWARTGELHSRDAVSGQASPLPATFELPAGLPTEAAVSRAAAWCHSAQAMGQPWRLLMPGDDTTHSVPGLDRAHLQAAMRRLAAWPGASGRQP